MSGFREFFFQILFSLSILNFYIMHLHLYKKYHKISLTLIKINGKFDVTV